MSIINPDPEFAKQIGFTPDKIVGWLWKEESRIIISCIDSLQPNQGNFSSLLKAIEQAGFEVAVPSLLPKMKDILIRKGFMPQIELDPDLGKIEVWTRLR